MIGGKFQRSFCQCDICFIAHPRIAFTDLDQCGIGHFGAIVDTADQKLRQLRRRKRITFFGTLF